MKLKKNYLLNEKEEREDREGEIKKREEI